MILAVGYLSYNTYEINDILNKISGCVQCLNATYVKNVICQIINVSDKKLHHPMNKEEYYLWDIFWSILASRRSIVGESLF